MGFGEVYLLGLDPEKPPSEPTQLAYAAAARAFKADGRTLKAAGPEGHLSPFEQVDCEALFSR